MTSRVNLQEVEKRSQAAKPVVHESADPLGRVWHQVHENWHATWRRRGDTNVFDAFFTRFVGDGTYDYVTAVITIDILPDGMNLKIRRTESSDSNDGEYVGAVLLITGQAFGTGYQGATSSNEIRWLAWIFH